MTRAKGRRLNLPSRGGTSGLRERKIVYPECRVPVGIQGKTEYTTGPCQQAVKQDPSLAVTWFKSCTHGPEMLADGSPIDEHMRPYYDVVIRIERTPVVEEGVIKEWREVSKYDAEERLTGVVVHDVAMSGKALQFRAERGAKDPSEFGLDPFCEYRGCWRQDIKQFSNGMFCSELHAKLVKARETGVMLAESGFDQGWPNATSSAKRREQIMAIEV